MNLPDIEKLRAMIRDIARDELLPAFGHADCEFKTDGSVVTAADLSMQNRLQQCLQQAWPDYALLGEEMAESQQQAVLASPQGYWCVDPLDGTSNFAAGLPFFAVSVALIIDGVQQIGVIYDPLRDEMFSAIRERGAWLNDRRLNARTGREQRHTIAEIDLKRLPEAMRLKLVVSDLYTSQRNVGSSAIDWCWLTAGRFDVYLHGGQKLWDYAAGSLIFQEAGGRALAFDAKAVFQGRLETRSVLASFDTVLFDRWYRELGLPY